MAAAAATTTARRLVVHGVGTDSGFVGKTDQLRRITSLISSTARRDYQVSQLVKPNGKLSLLVDAIDLVKILEAQGVPSEKAEEATETVVKLLNDSLESAAASAESRGKMPKFDVLFTDSKTKQLKDLARLKREMEIKHMTKEKLRKWSWRVLPPAIIGCAMWLLNRNR